jgi:hypothetical protein
MANNPENVTCFLRDTPCPGISTKCRAWDGEKCILLNSIEVFVDDLMKSRITVKHPESALPPEVNT